MAMLLFAIELQSPYKGFASASGAQTWTSCTDVYVFPISRSALTIRSHKMSDAVGIALSLVLKRC